MYNLALTAFVKYIRKHSCHGTHPLLNARGNNLLRYTILKSRLINSVLIISCEKVGGPIVFTDLANIFSKLPC